MRSLISDINTAMTLSKLFFATAVLTSAVSVCAGVKTAPYACSTPNMYFPEYKVEGVKGRIKEVVMRDASLPNEKWRRITFDEQGRLMTLDDFKIKRTYFWEDNRLVREVWKILATAGKYRQEIHEYFYDENNLVVKSIVREINNGKEVPFIDKKYAIRRTIADGHIDYCVSFVGKLSPLTKWVKYDANGKALSQGFLDGTPASNSEEDAYRYLLSASSQTKHELAEQYLTKVEDGVNVELVLRFNGSGSVDGGQKRWFNAQGDLVEEVSLPSDQRRAYRYEYDEQGNWIVMSEMKQEFQGIEAKEKYKYVEAGRFSRTIKYWP